MGSWLIIIISSILILIGIRMFLLFHWDIKKMTNQLDQIIENFGTNELIRTNTHHQTLSRFITKINQLIHLYKQDQQDTQSKEKKLKQEITNISHDLRTPLTSIKGFSELLTDPALTESERQEYLAIIQKKIHHITTMVDLFYELSQIDSLDKQVTMERQFLNQLIPEAMLPFYDDFVKNQLNVHMDEMTMPPVWADSKATHRIVTNLIYNALHYAKSYVTISLIEEEEYVRLSARNDVDALDRKELHRIFDRTFRLDTSRTSGQHGLGLHIVQQLINKQEGKAAAHVYENEFRIDISFKKWHEIGRL